MLHFVLCQELDAIKDDIGCTGTPCRKHYIWEPSSKLKNYFKNIFNKKEVPEFHMPWSGSLSHSFFWVRDKNVKRAAWVKRTSRGWKLLAT
jgi:hypothetical protein